MTWAGFYMLCFVVGFALSLLSFLIGSFDVHVPDMHMHGDLGHFGGADGLHGAHGGLDGGHGDLHGAGASHGLNTEPQMSWFNFGTVTAFLAWFGGTGYLLTRFSGLWLFAIFALSTAAGVVGAAAIFLFVAKFLMKHDKALDPADYDMVGVLGTVSVPIREGVIGEVIFSQEGSRRSVSAKGEKPEAIPVGTEVVVTRYEEGFAYVRRWEELAEEAAASGSGPAPKEN
jgi:membrane protein implicated in regulation of membrane protease activity